MLFQRIGRLGVEDVDGQDRPGPARIPKRLRHADRAEPTGGTSLEDRHGPVRRCPAQIAPERGKQEIAVAPVELLTLGHDLRRESKLIHELAIG